MPKLGMFGAWLLNIPLITLKRADDIRLCGTDDPDWFRTDDSVVAFWIRKPNAKRNTISFNLNQKELEELHKFCEVVLEARNHDKKK